MADVENLVSSEKKSNTKRKVNVWCSAVNCLKSDSITLSHVAGYLLHKCSQNTAAQPESNDLDDNKTLDCYLKIYDQDKSQFGGLHVPSASFLEYVVQLEAAFFENFSIYTKAFLCWK
ncbi:Hypothetical predicted protein [Paramuricea clavata]|uniref:Uncharacterized protein n=1 Tax=Paramuricea clavata TaxID=317549 RepID=A0A6S7FUZ0_PARCT|nr:Hypothetical predicted protein [Paramuricea clavata]